MPGKKIESNIYTGGMVTDLDGSAMSNKAVSYARNAMLRAETGKAPYYTNEPANIKCVDLPYKFNGAIELKEDRILVFSTNNTDSEIGIVNTLNCTYNTIINDQCLKFNTNSIITGTVRENTQGDEEVIFRDDISPVRILNIKDIPYKFTEANDECKTKTFTDELSCEDLRLFPNLDIPCLKATKSINGSLPNGSYQVAIAYSIDGLKFSDYYSLTHTIHINNEAGQSAIDIDISNLDRSFDEYRIILVGCVEGVTTSKLIGTFNTNQDNLTLSDWNNPEYLTISNEEIVVTKVNYEKAGIIASNAQYAILADLTAKSKFNVQEFSSQIKLEYVVHRCPADYYKNDGINKSYWRDENYSFHFRYVYGDGETTDRGHIIGRDITDKDKELVTGCDNYEIDIPDCNPEEPVYRWQAYNTAGDMVLENDTYNDRCCVEIGYGDLGYFQSTELYPDDVEIYGDRACTPILLHKMPDECKVPRYVVDNGKKYIQILGIRAKNIPYPTDSDGNPIENIVGYEILRGDRDGNNKTVVAAGMMTNVRSYNDKEEGRIMYSNFYNYLGEDPYLSKTQTIKNNGEQRYDPLTDYYKNRFNFYTPHGEFYEKYRMGNEFVFHTEEYANVQGYFENVYNHPSHKLLTNNAFYISALLGVIEAYLTINGKACVTSNYHQAFENVSTCAGYVPAPNTNLTRAIREDCDTVYSLAGGVSGNNTITDPIRLASRTVTRVLQTVANVASFVMVAAEYANNILEVIKNFTKPRDYVYQYVSKSDFVGRTCIKEGMKRRGTLSQPLYLEPHVHNINGETFNNFQKQRSIYVELTCDIDEPGRTDTTLKTINQFGSCGNPEQRVNSRASMFYATSKIKNPNQYGQINSIKVVKVTDCVQKLPSTGLEVSPTFFGGDAIIAKHSVNIKQPFFTQNLGNSELPDETPYDYRIYRNIAYPRFWADFTEYDMGDIMNIFGNSPSTVNQAALPNQKYNLDCDNSSSPFVANNEYMYTRVNGVLDFFVEADYNISFRTDFQEEDAGIHQPHFSDQQSNLSYIFREDRARKTEGYYLDTCYRSMTINQVFSKQIENLDQIDRQSNGLIYSLPQFNTQQYNNWRYFLPGNYTNFDEGEFGKLSGVHALDQDRLIFLFTKQSPYISLGRDTLQTTEGRTVTIGDGGLFARQPRAILNTDVAYGSSHDPHAFVSTQFGHFYPSSRQGKLFNFRGDSLDEISRQGMLYWCSEYSKILLKEDFPNYQETLNPNNGVGYQVVFDNEYETIYFCKRDYCLKEEYKGILLYDSDIKEFMLEDQIITMGDSKYFDDASVTLSYYAGGGKTGNFVSFHDWHPDWTIQQENHFITVKENSLYKHNETCKKYCNFYGQDFPHEIEIIENQHPNAHYYDSVEYIQEALVYPTTNCTDYVHVYKETFDEAIVWNSEQNSGILQLEFNENKRGTSFNYPKIIDNKTRLIPYSKKEQKFRFNMFTDKTKERGQYINNFTPMWNTHCNGYIKELNEDYIDIKKPSKQSKKFNHTHHRVRLKRNISDNIRFIHRIINSKITNPSHI